MSTDFEAVYRMALKLPPDERARLADYLVNPPPPLTAEEILGKISAQAGELREMGVEKIGLFGSYVRGEADPASDIDILVSLRAAPLFTGYMRVKLYLEDLLAHPVDLVPEENLRQELRDRILGEVIYAQGL
jgi:predicted nucleotidyltransferase